jgi:hypothetical protein
MGVVTIEKGYGAYRIAFMPHQGVLTWPKPLAEQALDWARDCILAYPEMGVVVAVIDDDGTSLFYMVPPDDDAGGPIQ